MVWVRLYIKKFMAYAVKLHGQECWKDLFHWTESKALASKN